MRCARQKNARPICKFENSQKAFDYSKFLPLMELTIPISHICCKIMKKEPFKKYQKQTGLYHIVGTTTEESILRKSSWIDVDVILLKKVKKSEDLFLYGKTKMFFNMQKVGICV